MIEPLEPRQFFAATPAPEPGPDPASAATLGDLSAAKKKSPQASRSDTVGPTDSADFYAFTLTRNTHVSLSLDKKLKNTALSLHYANGDRVPQVMRPTSSVLSPGTWYAAVTTTNPKAVKYKLKLTTKLPKPAANPTANHATVAATTTFSGAEINELIAHHPYWADPVTFYGGLTPGVGSLQPTTPSVGAGTIEPNIYATPPDRQPMSSVGTVTTIHGSGAIAGSSGSGVISGSTGSGYGASSVTVTFTNPRPPIPATDFTIGSVPTTVGPASFTGAGTLTARAYENSASYIEATGSLFLFAGTFTLNRGTINIDAAPPAGTTTLTLPGLALSFPLSFDTGIPDVTIAGESFALNAGAVTATPDSLRFGSGSFTSLTAALAGTSSFRYVDLYTPAALTAFGDLPGVELATLPRRGTRIGGDGAAVTLYTAEHVIRLEGASNNGGTGPLTFTGGTVSPRTDADRAAVPTFLPLPPILPEPPPPPPPGFYSDHAPLFGVMPGLSFAVRGEMDIDPAADAMARAGVLTRAITSSLAPTFDFRDGPLHVTAGEPVDLSFGFPPSVPYTFAPGQAHALPASAAPDADGNLTVVTADYVYTFTRMNLGGSFQSMTVALNAGHLPPTPDTGAPVIRPFVPLSAHRELLWFVGDFMGNADTTPADPAAVRLVERRLISHHAPAINDFTTVRIQDGDLDLVANFFFDYTTGAFILRPGQFNSLPPATNPTEAEDLVIHTPTGLTYTFTAATPTTFATCTITLTG